MATALRPLHTRALTVRVVLWDFLRTDSHTEAVRKFSHNLHACGPETENMGERGRKEQRWGWDVETQISFILTRAWTGGSSTRTPPA